MGDNCKPATWQPTVSVIIPCRNEFRQIGDCISSIFSQVEPEGGLEVIVADGMSEDGTRELLTKIGDQIRQSGDAGRKSKDCDATTSPGVESRGSAERSRADPAPFSRFRVIDNPGCIASTGLNAAIRIALGQIIIRMDAHTEYAPDYLKQCVHTLQETGAENVGGPARTKAETYLERAIAAAYHSPFSVGGARFHDPDFEGYVDTVTYGCWRKSTFEKFGLFDEELARNQDDEHNLRITRGGGKVYQSPSIQSWYRPRGTLNALFRQYMQYGYWKVRVIQKHKIPASWRHLVPGTFVFTLMLLLLLSVFCFLLSAFASAPRSLVNGQWSAVFHFCLLLSAFCFVSLVAAYLIAVVAASLHTVWRATWRLLPILPMVFGCYHFGYGYGFLRGLWGFVIRPGGTRAGFQRLTR